MAHYYSNDCLDCGKPCLYEVCRYYKVKHFRCDNCGEEDITLYHYDGDEICEECLLKAHEIVEGSGNGW